MRNLSFKELLSNVDSREDLSDICRNNNIKNFAKKDRAGLEEWIFQTMNNKQYIKDLLDTLPESAVLLLDLLIKESGLDQAKGKFLASYSANTYHLNLRRLTGSGIIFAYIENEIDFYAIPKEFKPWIKEYIKENGISIEEAVEEEESSAETSEFKDFDALAWSAIIPIDNLRSFLEEHELAIDGTKMALIHRIFYEKQLSREDFLSMFGKEELKIIAEILGLTKGGNKQEIINRIVEKLPLKHSIEEFSQVEDTSETEIEEETIVEKPSTILKLFSSDAISPNKIREILEKKGFESKGSNRQIVKRLLEELQVPINEVFNEFTGDELKDICARYGLKRRGKKSDLIDTILGAFNPGNLNLRYSETQAAQAKTPTSVAYEATPKTSPRPAPRKKEKERSKTKGRLIFDLLKEELDDREYWTPKSFINAKVFTESIRRSVLRLKKDGKLDINVEPQKDLQDVIAIDGHDVLIFCTVITKKESVQIFLSTFGTVRRGFTEVIALIWDPEQKILNADERNIEGIDEDTEGLYLIKKMSDYSTVKGSDDG